MNSIKINNFIKFTCPDLDRNWNANKDNGIGGWDKVFKLPKWKDDKSHLFTKDVYDFMCNDKHKVNCVLTGQISNITVFDFDIADEYYKCIEKYPQLKNSYTIKTSKGFHIYCKYNSDYKTTANKLIGIDIRNDSAFVFGEETKTEFNTSYDYYCGNTIDIEMPFDFYKYIVPNENFKSKPNKKEDMCKPIHSSIIDEIQPDDEILLKYCECINISDIDNYDTWVKLLWSLQGHKDVARKLSRMGNNYQQESFEKVFHDYKDRGLTIKTFYEFAKKGNRDKYFEILSGDPNKPEVVEKIDVDELYNDIDFANITTNKRKAEMMYDFLKENIVIIEAKKEREPNLVYIFDEHDNNWYFDPKLSKLRILISKLFKKIGDLALNKTEKFEVVYDEKGKQNKKITDEYKHIDKLIKSNEQLPEIKNVTSDLIDIIIEHNKNNKPIEFDINTEQLYNLHFKNGVVDVTTKKFRKREKTDYVSVWLDWDYIPNTETFNKEIEDVKDFFNKIQPIEEQRNFTLQFLAYSLTGDIGEQIFKMNYGQTASNGKSTELDIHCSVFPIYTTNIARDTFNSDNTKAHKQFHKIITQPIRLVFMEELDRKKLDGESFKSFVDARNFSVEQMFGTSDVKTHQAKLVATSNKTFSIEKDKGILRRGIQQNYTSQFKEKKDFTGEKNEYEKIKNFSTKFENVKFKNAYLFLLLENYKKQLDIPQTNKDLFKESIESSDIFVQVCDENLEITNHDDDRVQQDDMKVIFEDAKINWREASLKLKDTLCLKYDKAIRGGGNGNKKGCWLGVKIIKDETII